MMWVPVKNLVKVCDPLAHPPWERGMPSITREEIECRIRRGRLIKYPEYNPVTLIPETRDDHISRIAWLVVYGWGNSPIAIDFTAGEWALYDGNHRFGAAICRQDEMIWSDVCGDLNCIRKLYED